VATLLPEDGPGEPGPGGAVESRGPFHAQHGFYNGLLSREREVLREMRRLAGRRPEAWRKTVERSDIEPMEALVEQFEQRLRFWQHREREASPD
jgi:hypothetical protein